MATFESLPREIRIEIYKISLYVPKDIVAAAYAYEPTYSSDHKGPLPGVGLLSVNKRVRTEALPVLISINTWRITSRYLNMNDAPLNGLRPLYDLDSLWSHYGCYVKRAVVKFSHGDIDPRLRAKSLPKPMRIQH